jgi:hypothetical protein
MRRRHWAETTPMVETKFIEQKKRVSVLLAEVADGKLGVEEALRLTEKWSDIDWRDKFFADAYHYHALQHFKADADIRSQDSEYALSQTSWLRSLSRKLLTEE